MSKRWRI